MAKDHCVASPELKNAKRPRNLQIPLFLPNSPVGTANPGQAFRTCPDLFIELNQSSDQSIRTDCEMVKCLLFPFVFYKKKITLYLLCFHLLCSTFWNYLTIQGIISTCGNKTLSKLKPINRDQPFDRQGELISF